MGFRRRPVWQQKAYGTTYEPVVFAYHKPALPEDQVPRTRAALAQWLVRDSERLQGKVVGYDIQKSGLGFFVATQDAALAPEAFWDVVRSVLPDYEHSRVALREGQVPVFD